MSVALSLQRAMREALLADVELTALLGGGHIFDEVPRGAAPPFVAFTETETRDWSTMDQKAHEHRLRLAVSTNARSRALAEMICTRIDAVLDNAVLALDGHRLVNLRLLFCSVSKGRDQSFGAELHFRAATEPNL